MTLSIAATDITALRERCGVAVLRTVRADPAYENGAVLPTGPWTSITDDTAQDLVASSPIGDSTLVELVKPPVPAEALSSLIQRLGDPEAIHLGQARAPMDVLTTTRNHENDGYRIGLHVDNWDRLPYATKHTGRRRICINLGPGTRYLLLADLDIRTICRALYQDYADRYPHTDDLRRYVGSGHTVLCYRIRLEPGEGYIAPTELFPHDGSTEGLLEPSTAAFWLGHWPRGVLPSLI
ncbi:hypothetical protein QFZ82_004632 [Streptomyces sp. V4I23]|uniref:hypothetical protein n=1 Tax=Streptomyces sp. V4I23 TaxID=3042282 RepID=UPI00278B3107|nr:hypothetical protein [Streptomyces sp. V4I23]MDQ1010147.1 hypothetical protein [Streptomyces sp. V4I23]